MNKNTTVYLYYLSGILFGLTAVINFIDSKIAMGVTYLCLGIAFASLGAAYKKKSGKDHSIKDSKNSGKGGNIDKINNKKIIRQNNKN